MLDFYVGQRVVCVNAEPSFRGGCLGGLSESRVYTVRWVGVDEESDLVIRLVEIRRPPLRRDPRNSEIGYRATRFRPLIQTDISSLEAMLAPKPATHRESENA